MVTAIRKTSSISKVLGVKFLTPELQKVTPPMWEEGEWVAGHATYKNNLINAITRGMKDVVLIHATTEGELEYLPEGVILDGASGSRKHGIFIGSKNPDGFIKQYLSGNKVISHGSILFSECPKGMGELTDLDYRVVDHKTTWGHGEGCGLISMTFFTSILTMYGEEDLTPRQIQFRWADPDKKYLAKGTLIPVPDDLMEGHLELNDAMFKGQCPKLGKTIHSKLSYFGIIKYGTVRRFGFNHQVTANFRTKESQQYLLSLAKDEMDYLLSIRSNPKLVVEKWLDCFMVDGDGEEDEDGVEGVEEEQETDIPLHWRMASIIKADKYDQLLHHPKTCQYVNSIMRRMVLNVATGAGFKGLHPHGLMAAPLYGLPPGVVISSSLKAGTYIMWRYPVRHHMDVQLVTVYNPTHIIKDALGSFIPNHHYVEGSFYVNPDWFVDMAGDFDGDEAVFLHIPDPTTNPLVKEMTQAWKPIPTIPKPDDKPIPYTLVQAAIKSSENAIGLVVRAMSACRILNWDSEFSKLGEQIQITVEGYKRGTEPDQEYLDDIYERIDDCLPKYCWLRWHKNDLPFTIPNTNDHFWGQTRDTIGLLWNQTVTMWTNGYVLSDNNRGIIHNQSDLNEVGGMGVSPFLPMYTGSFRYLFDHVDLNSNQLKWAKGEWGIVQRPATEIMSEVNRIKQEIEDDKKNNSGCNAYKLKQELKVQYGKLMAVYDAFVERIDTIREQKADDPLAVYNMCAAFWRVTHYSDAPVDENGDPYPFNPFRTNSILFKAFHLELIKMLQVYRGNKFRLWTNRYNAPSDVEQFNDGAFSAKVVRRTLTYQDKKTNKQKVERVLYLVDTVSEKWLGRITTTGLMAGSFIPAEGTQLVVQIKTLTNGKGKPSCHQCTVLDDTLF